MKVSTEFHVTNFSATTTDHWHTFDYSRPHVDGLLMLQQIKAVSQWCPLLCATEQFIIVHYIIFDGPSEYEGITGGLRT